MDVCEIRLIYTTKQKFTKLTTCSKKCVGIKEGCAEKWYNFVKEDLKIKHL